MKKISTRMILTAILIGIWTFSIHLPTYAAESIEKHNTQDQSSIFYWIIFIIGGCIALTLSYVSWRKYEAEVKKKKGKDHDSVD